MSIEDLIAKYGCGGGAEEVEDSVNESETEDEDEEGMTCILFSWSSWMWLSCHRMFCNLLLWRCLFTCVISDFRVLVLYRAFHNVVLDYKYL
jgi:hypothetical protein